MRQIVNTPCGVCGETIRSELDAEVCPKCHAAVHEACRKSAADEEGCCQVCGSTVLNREVAPLEVTTVSDNPRPQPIDLFLPIGRCSQGAYILRTIFEPILALAFQGIVFVGCAALPFEVRGIVGVLAICGIEFLLTVRLLVLTARRFHDIGKSGKWAFLLLVPVIGQILGLYLWFKKGEPGPNVYGPDPVPHEDRLSPGESFLSQGNRLEMNGEWDRALDFYDQAVRELAGTADAEYAANCLQRLREKIAASGPA